MVSLQEFLDNKAIADRQAEFGKSDQLSLGELILKLEAVSNQESTLLFDYNDCYPSGLDSWRGIYRELAVGHSTAEELNYGKNLPTVASFLQQLREAVGAEFIGYKGGEFVMSRHTPIWVANYGSSSSWSGNSRGIVDVRQPTRKETVLITKEMDPYDSSSLYAKE